MRLGINLGIKKIVPAVVFSVLFSPFRWPLCRRSISPFTTRQPRRKPRRIRMRGSRRRWMRAKDVYARNCLACHGKTGQGTGNVPSLVDGKLNGVTAGEVFWFVTKGDKENGMPSWAALPEQERWQIVTYVEAMASGKAGAGPSAAPAPEVDTGRIEGRVSRTRRSPISAMRSRGRFARSR